MSFSRIPNTSCQQFTAQEEKTVAARQQPTVPQNPKNCATAVAVVDGIAFPSLLARV